MLTLKIIIVILTKSNTIIILSVNIFIVLLLVSITKYFMITKQHNRVKSSEGDPLISRKRILIHISEGLILYYFS